MYSTRLLILLDFGPRTEHIPALASGVNLVFNSELVEVRKEVLDLGVGLGASSASKVVEGGDLCKDVVDDSNDDNDTNRVTPDNNNSDNVNVTVDGEVSSAGGVGGLLGRVTAEPAEDTEEGSNGIDTKKWHQPAATRAMS